jgi:aryl-alcohol dehydrogenase-like predicted oxidoreductase
VERRVLGGTGISVSEFAFGSMMLGERGNPDHREGIEMIHTALDAGINIIDTADIYSGGECEEIVGKALAGRRSDVVLATKFGLPIGGDPNTQGGSSRWIKRAVENSLRRLNTDYIDLYQMHRPDYFTDIDETLGALSDLVSSGKVRAIGCSTFAPDLIVEAHWAAERGGHRHFRTEQPRYSILNRSIEANVLPLAERYRMGILTYGPLATGWLSGRADPTAGYRNSRSGKREFDLTVPANQAKVEAVAKLTALAHDAGLPLPHLALAFVLSHPTVTSVLIGPRTLEQLTDLLASDGVRLSEDVLDRIDEIVPPGTEINPADIYFATPPAVLDTWRRRR